MKQYQVNYGAALARGSAPRNFRQEADTFSAGRRGAAFGRTLSWTAVSLGHAKIQIQGGTRPSATAVRNTRVIGG